MTKITYEDKMRYLAKLKGSIQGNIAMIQRLHPEGDFRLGQMQQKLDLIESIIEDVIGMKQIMNRVVKEEKYGF